MRVNLLASVVIFGEQRQHPKFSSSKGSTEYHAKIVALPSSEEGARWLGLEPHLSVSLAVQTEQVHRTARLTNEPQRRVLYLSKPMQMPQRRRSVRDWSYANTRIDYSCRHHW